MKALSIACYMHLDILSVASVLLQSRVGFGNVEWTVMKLGGRFRVYRFEA